MEARPNYIIKLLVVTLLVATITQLDSCLAQEFKPMIETSSGVLLGAKEMLNNSNNSVYKFLSVPYAEAPIGELRFKRPVEIKQQQQQQHNGTIDASKFKNTCPQYRHLFKFISPLLNIDQEHQTSEDCLHLHIYVPATVGSAIKNNAADGKGASLEIERQLPVIVWIPGEGFDFADARQFDGSYLAHKTQSIVVTVQYRVGVLGFLHAPEHNIMGNMGIHDQLMALKWIKKNILAFGGDSDRVTLMGRFSGSMSISAMITAPKQELLKDSNGKMLFNRVALLSGIAVEDWIIDSHQAERVKYLENSALIKGYCSSAQNGFECLQNLSIDQLLKISDFGWRLVIDNELIGEHSPIEAIKMKNQFVSELDGVLIGETGMEGTLCLYRHMLESQNNNYAKLIEEDKMTTSDLYEIIRYDSNAYFGLNMTKTNPIQVALESMVEETIANNILSSEDGQQQQQQQQRDVASKLREKYLNACSSYMIKSHLKRFKRNILARNQFADNRMDSSKKPIEVFHYELKYKPTFSLAPDYIKTAAHGDDVPLIFGLIYNQPKRNINDADLLMTRKMMAYVGNFVHGNNPLLDQHSIIDTAAAAAAAAKQSTTQAQGKENETTSMDDENEMMTQNVSEVHQQQHISSSSSSRRNWSNEGSIHVIEFDENDSNEIVQVQQQHQSQSNPKRHQHQNLGAAATTNGNHTSTSETAATRRVYLKGDPKSSNIRVIVVENPQLLNTAIELKAQSIIDTIIEQQQQQQQQQQRNQQLVDNNYQYDHLTKSQRLLELHRQQQQQQQVFGESADNYWFQSLRKNSAPATVFGNSLSSHQQQQQLQTPQAQQQTTMTLVNESSFMTMLIFSSCIVIFALMSLCLGLCLVIFRNNLSAINSSSSSSSNNNNNNNNSGKSQMIHHFDKSTCNICDNSQGNSIEAVLGGNRKDARGFSNVFAKLRNHNNHMTTTAPTQPQCTSTTSTQNNNNNNTRQQLTTTTGGQTDLILHQRIGNTPNDEHQSDSL